MPELRWILLGTGVVFLGLLFWWELRRHPRQPPMQYEEPPPSRFREPPLGLPEVRAREVTHALPVVEFDDSMIGLRLDGVRIEQDLVAVDRPMREPDVVDAPVARAADSETAIGNEELPTYEPDAYEPEPEAYEPEAIVPVALEPTDPGPESDVSGEPTAADPPTVAAAPDAPLVEWPPEERRTLLSVRVTAKPGLRLSGRAIRLALFAEGFTHGKYAIFHKCAADGHVMVSAASLTKPGCFDLDSMDSQRYSGLGLFSMLPGPISDRRMLDELLESARNLVERLDGVLQNEHGTTLEAAEVEALRASFGPDTLASDADVADARKDSAA